MSTRRSPGVLKERGSTDNLLSSSTMMMSNSSKSSNNSHHEGGGGSASSPSRDDANKKTTKTKRSCLENGRLCLLRSRGRSCWLGLILAGGILITTNAALQKMLEDKDVLPYGTSGGSQQRLRMTYDDVTTSMGAAGGAAAFATTGNRILSQSISDRISISTSSDEKNKEQPPQYAWKAMTGKELFQRANYQPKPLMMGFILVANRDSMANHYNIRKRRSSQLQKLEIPPPSDHSSGSEASADEQFQTIRINYQDHGQYQYLDPPQPEDKQQPPPMEWTFQNVLVAELGTGVERQKEITTSSKDYTRFKPDAPPSGCEPQYDWQTKSFPNCNELHQIDILTRLRTLNPAEEPESILLARGGYRDVWFVEQNDLPPEELGETIAMKTLLYEHPWTERNMDRHRRDALATDRLHRSPNALDLFGYCGNTGLYEFADGGSLEDAVDNEIEYNKWTSKTKMKYAYQVAVAIADVHNIDQEGLPSMSHTDISMSQFVSADGGKNYKINDFNRARFLFRDAEDHNKLCKFEVSSNKGKFRSPEEYAYKPESAAIDTYSMGNIFYVLLTGDYPFEDVAKKEVREMVKKGQRPEIDSKYLHSEDTYEQTLVEAIRRCWIQNPSKRATSREIEEMLRPLAQEVANEEAEKEKEEEER